MGTVPGNKYTGEEREGPGTNTSGSTAHYLPSSLTVTIGFSNTVSISVGGGVPHVGGSQEGSGYVVSQRKWTYSLNGSLTYL